MKDCIGHFGHIDLALPVFHYGYFKPTLAVLRKICKTCSRVLLPEEAIAKFTKMYQTAHMDATKRKELNKMVGGHTEKVRVCPHCGASNGKVQKVAALKMIHTRYLTTADAQPEFDKATSAVRDLQNLLDTKPPKVQEDMNPVVVQHLFRNVHESDCLMLDLAVGTRPEALLINTMLVPPVPIRPSIPAVDGSNTCNIDDITALFRNIAFYNNGLANFLEAGHESDQIMQQWEMLQLLTAQVINGELTIGSAQQQNSKSGPFRGFSQRLKGKSGRFRGNLNGKRVDFSSRTVISPDPNLGIDQVAVPRDVCMTLTFPQRVTARNIEQLRGFVLNGPKKHPGANIVIVHPERPGGKKMYYSLVVLREERAANLKIGDIVERHLMDGDVVLFNRQPSLHKVSIMAHRVKVRPWRTFRFNECVCNPYNADFDGDEMNLHVPQTEEARAEAAILMGTKHNICTPRNGTPLIAAIQDFITGAYLLTQKDAFLTRGQFSQLASIMCNNEIHVPFPIPAIIKPKQLWTGKQLMTLMLASLPLATGEVLRLNLAKTCKAGYTDEKKATHGQIKEMCANDGYLLYFNTYHVSGSLDKKSIGDGNKETIFYLLMKDYNADVCADAMLRISKLTCAYLQMRGFSLGIGDVSPSANLTREKRLLVETGYAECDQHIAERDLGDLKPMPGCTVDGTLEANITAVLNKIREKAGDMCQTELARFNAPTVMARCGSKGGILNISQMIACVGQQTIGGNRIPDGFEDRALPHFGRNSAIPAAKGFVANSFYTGLRPSEFFFHTMAGREGLVDTAVKTAETGYMSRRLMKALEDLSTDYDLSVHNSSGALIQFRYGDDGLDPASMEGMAGYNDAPVNLPHLWTFVTREREGRSKRCLYPYQIRFYCERLFKSELFAELRHIHNTSSDDNREPEHLFITQMRDFLVARCVDMANARMIYGLPALFHGPEDADGEDISELNPDKEPDHFNSWLRGLDAIDNADAPGEDMNADGGAKPWLATCAEQAEHLSMMQLENFLELAAKKYAGASIDPGTAVGAVGAQSIGEPGTQMTLKTFHFAGIASMNITLGVPRIKEIINASKNISTPVITAPLENKFSPEIAKATSARIEKCLLGDLIDYIDEVYTDSEAYLLIKVDLDHIKQRKVDLTITNIAEALLAVSALKLKADMITIVGKTKLRVVPSTAKSTMFFALQTLRQEAPKVMVKGHKGIERCIISLDKKTKEHKLMVEGTDVRAVMGTRGVAGTRVTSNHVIEVERALGIEAARNRIMYEIQYTMKEHGMTIDARHVMLLADLMTFKGEVHGITRFGIAKMKDSVFMLASFEKTADHLFEAALHGTKVRRARPLAPILYPLHDSGRAGVLEPSRMLTLLLLLCLVRPSNRTPSAGCRNASSWACR